MFSIKPVIKKKKTCDFYILPHIVNSIINDMYHVKKHSVIKEMRYTVSFCAKDYFFKILINAK